MTERSDLRSVDVTQDPGSGAPMSERMQTLLSRAVEDQLTEQRQVAGALTEVHAELARIGGRLESLQQRPAADVDLTGELQEAVRLLGERIDAVARLVQQRGHDLAELRAAVDDLRTAIGQHGASLAGITSGLSALPAFGERIDTLHGGLTALHERLRGLEELSAATDGVLQRADAHDTALRELRQAFTGVAARAAQLPGRDDVEGMLARLVEPTEALGNRLGRVEASFPSLLERLDQIADDVAGHAEALAAVRVGAAAGGPPGAGAGDADIAGLASSLQELRDAVAELSARSSDAGALDALVDRLDALEDRFFGADGLEQRLRPVAVEPADPPTAIADVEALVARAVSDSERRLADHVDAAVLALAEALLRRRRPVARDRAVPATPVMDDEPDDELDVEELDDELDADDGGHDPDEPADPDPAAADMPGPARWQTPVVPADAAPTVDAEATESPEARKRKPWWRPGG